ncbi:MAG: hypothetical protein JKY19_09450 [Alcanivoracaceae bacterium]|nr:hypothetical protein [Alcanivoracaceae bacterium]
MKKHSHLLISILIFVLAMTGKHGFTKLMSSPGEIDDAFEDILEENR